MKTRIILISLVALFFLGCNTPESDAPQKSAKQLAFEKYVKETLKNPEFRNAISNHYSSDLHRDGNPNQGAFVINNPYGPSYVFPLEGDKFLFCGATDTNGTITFLPNGTARFNVRSNEPLAFVIDLSTPSISFPLSNEMDTNKTGNIFSNVVSNYFQVNNPYGSLYFQSEPVSGSVFRLNTTICDSQPIIEEGVFIGYTPETVRKNVSVRIVSPPNGNGNGTFSVQIN